MKIERLNYTLLLLGEPKGIWYFDATYLEITLKLAFMNAYPGNQVPLWIDSLKGYPMREEAHCNNALKRSVPGNTCTTYIGFVLATSMNQEIDVTRTRINDNIEFMYDVMKEFITNLGGKFSQVTSNIRQKL